MQCWGALDVPDAVNVTLGLMAGLGETAFHWKQASEQSPTARHFNVPWGKDFSPPSFCWYMKVFEGHDVRILVKFQSSLVIVQLFLRA